MAIFKNCQASNFAMIPNELLDDTRLSWKAKGVLCYLLRLPPDWKVYSEEIAKHSTDGIDSLTTTINELILVGYIKRDKLRGTKGRFGGYEYSVYSTPTVTDISKNGETKNGLSKNGKSKAINTNLTKTNLTKKDTTKKEYIILSNDDHIFLKIYNIYYKEKFGKAHMKIVKEKFLEVEAWINSLEQYGIDTDYFTEGVEKHFDNLPSRNNGNILAFMEASHRHFEVANPRQEAEGY